MFIDLLTGLISFNIPLYEEFLFNVHWPADWSYQGGYEKYLSSFDEALLIQTLTGS